MNTPYFPIRLFPVLLWIAGGLVILFLIAPVIAIVPLSFNAEPFFTYPMPGLSLRWYEEFFSSQVWQLALQNSVIVAVCATILSTLLGTLAALRPQPAGLPGARDADRHPDLADDRAGDRLGGRHLLRLCRSRPAQFSDRLGACAYRDRRTLHRHHGDSDAGRVSTII